MNKDQQNAAQHDGGHALVLAGPGTGKTSTLVERVRVLVQDRNVSPSQIMVTTFTSKAGKELKDRLGGIIGESATKNLTVGTFHSICLRLLRKWPDAADLRPGFEIIEDGEKKKIVREAIPQAGIDTETALAWIERWKEEGKRPDEVRKQVNPKTKAGQAAIAFGYYEAELRNRGACDFPKIIGAATEAGYDDPRLIGWFRRFEHVLVDEFQDVNALQVRFVSALARGNAQIWAVGDDDQAIYAFRGSDVGYILRFEDHFPGATEYQLRTVYRVPPSSLSGANAIAAKTTSRRRKKMTAQKRGDQRDDLVSIKGFENNEAEAEWIERTVKSLVNGGISGGNVGILFRSASVAPIIERRLRGSGLDVEVRGAQNSWSTPEAKLVVKTLRMLHEPQRQADFQVKSGRDREIAKMLEDLKHTPIQEAGYPVGRVIAQNPPGNADEDRIGQWADTAIDVGRVASRCKDYETFLDYADRAANGRPDDPDEAVTLTTIHSAKGLEWPFVIIAGCENKLIPHGDAESRDEERRLFYVAATRTKRLLVMTYVKTRFNKRRIPSPFLREFAAGVDAIGGHLSWPDRENANQIIGNGEDEIDKRTRIVDQDSQKKRYQAPDHKRG